MQDANGEGGSVFGWEGVAESMWERSGLSAPLCRELL